MLKPSALAKVRNLIRVLSFFFFFFHQILRIKGFNVGWFKWSFIRNFENTFSCFAVAIFDLVHDVEAIFTFLNCYKYLETVFLIEPRNEKTGFLHVRKQRRRSAPLFSLHG